ncbi:MAG: sugar phosphate isomerase/epimerase [Clostridia bacterium]|nr:sugar phosphate isomerase/epimerase [Clostridia bacterium]
MKNPISIGIGKIDIKIGLEKTLEVIAEAGYQYVDFWLCLYCDKPDAPMRSADRFEWVEKTAKLFRSFGLSVGQCHAYWKRKKEIGEDFSFDMPEEMLIANFDACRMLGADRLVFHPLERWMDMPDEETRKKILDINVEFFGSMVRKAEETGVHINIENLFDHKHKLLPGNPGLPCGRAEDLIYITDKIGSEYVGVCLDTGHANIAGEDIPGMIRKLGGRLGSLHINDNFGLIGPIYEDLHLTPGYGRIDWKQVLEALSETGYSGTLNMELIGEFSRMPLEILVLHLENARKTMQLMRDLYTPGA